MMFIMVFFLLKIFSTGLTQRLNFFKGPIGKDASNQSDQAVVATTPCWAFRHLPTIQVFNEEVEALCRLMT
jgi:hypothetical protein